ncbi:MAG: aminotransferase class III-fold pyridoxal phosphate-dependent enzyme [Erysipelotrichia bacterium]|nr:aminotransferase class III-fold pyridoxal phosphate-dependent enzyme [Erysipelotrichia bacterium]NCC55400.1 aminotransferase class III-fold pyridoxal phosphate-dependent enzyme [Erysipelotrichia bacterium]
MSEIYSYPNSEALFKEAEKVIPSGIYGHLNPQINTDEENAYPFFSKRCKKSYFWDIDDHRFIDYMCAYGPNVLGYLDEDVEQAVQAQMQLGNCMSAPSAIMVDFAKLLVDTVASADWAFFAKNGNDVTTGAIMCARAYTKRKKIVFFKGGYHGSSPWTQTGNCSGVLEEEVCNNIYVKWNDIEAVKKVFKEHKGEIAAIISQPYMHGNDMENEMPAENFWQTIRQLCDEEKTILIIDDVRTGFRLDLAGSDHYFHFEADLICFCKAIANGYNVSALCGKNFLKQSMSDLHYTGSYWMSAIPFAAGIACIKKMKRLNLPQLLKAKGEKLCAGLQEVARQYGYTLHISGAPALFYLHLEGKDPTIHQRWIHECVKRGVYFSAHHNHFINASLSDEDIEETINIVKEVFQVLKEEGLR